ncbi:MULTISPECIES: HAD family hydrolase [unclassified Paenibacillus]|uniref:HAD family hydrolase n=1 Tax=unclassified Paenibacillus TaxID=185978 RepID=UPI002406DC15|nr:MULTISPECIES: HAD family hydrolase [unclassified Paenibacillus]MDF9841506.1 phosphoglycolate phosphatase [Paenibacillus sp. PastF-2]MDF9848095.1 phosphoglycolate phosphatase [Paenibacillus sp. PastM-2]MDF9854664.1 phosphoglycolate phosphatase [Paenibacillus sp. PastF-1]MDH6479728.1 phosphoglycolate phosphatase [Paenibacillus sp. PastH-2]MDH6507370.1 phosphoglycolate phosphatase [Paenibacillus sp. PastM-3]
MDSIIFDLDGTMWDSSDVVTVAWNDVLRRYGDIPHVITKESLQGIMGLLPAEVGKILLPGVEEAVQQRLLDECCEAECDYLVKQGGSLYEELEAVLTALSAKYKLFIVSNCQKGYIEAFYEYHQLGRFFADYENPGRTGLPKGENIRLIMQRNNLESPVYVGDTAGDQKAAAFAGIPFVFASYGFGEVSDPDYTINRLSDLLELFN